MNALPMPGGVTMPMGWLPMCGQTWIGAAVSFVGMWTVMMAAMMLPSLVAALWRYRRSIGRAGELRSAAPTLLVAGGYLLVWMLLGAAIYPAGAATMAVTMSSPTLLRAAPVAIGLVVLSAGAFQLTRWKARHLACCRDDCRRAPSGRGRAAPVKALAALRQGLSLGAHCSLCCAGLTAALLVTGLMNGPAMIAAAAALNLERLAPAGERVARGVGVAVMGAGLLLTVRAIAL